MGESFYKISRSISIMTILISLSFGMVFCGGGGGSTSGGGIEEQDTIAPVPGSDLTFGITSTTITAMWDAASDNESYAWELEYKLVAANNVDEIDTIEEANAVTGNGLLMDWTSNITQFIVYNLEPVTSYAFTVLVRDDAGNLARYEPKLAATTKINPNGTYDSLFNKDGAGANGTVFAMACQSDKKILIGGNFTTYNGVDIPDQIIRLNTNGTVDTTFNTGGSGADDDVKAISIQDDGKILIGGYFTTYNGVDVPNGIIRLNTDGSIDSTFNNGGSGANGDVFALSIQNDGKILVGTNIGFTTYNGVNVPHGIIRLNSDGLVDTSFNNGGAGSSYIKTIGVQADGKILIGGALTTYNGSDVPDRIIRLNDDGTVDANFNKGGTGANNNVYAMSVLSNGKILIAGDFTTYNGSDVPDRIIRLNTDGTVDNTFNSGGDGANIAIWSMAVQDDGKIIIGGNFTQYNGYNISYCIARLNADGTADTFGKSANSAIYTINIQNDGKILIGGSFSTYNEVTVPRYVIRLL